jgi:hypothetical protein
MPEFLCPLCGHYHSTKKYEPDELPLDIVGPNRIGLGRRGTRIDGFYSFPKDDDVCLKIVERVLDLCRLFLDRDMVSVKEVRSRLGIVEKAVISVSLKEHNRLKEDLEALRAVAEDSDRNARSWKDRADELQRSVNTYSEKVDKLEKVLSVERSRKSRLIKEIEESKVRFIQIDEVLDDIIELFEDRRNLLYDSSDENETKEDFIYDSIKKLVEDLEALEAENDE